MCLTLNHTLPICLWSPSRGDPHFHREGGKSKFHMLRFVLATCNLRSEWPKTRDGRWSGKDREYHWVVYIRPKWTLNVRHFHIGICYRCATSAWCKRDESCNVIRRMEGVNPRIAGETVKPLTGEGRGYGEESNIPCKGFFSTSLMFVFDPAGQEGGDLKTHCVMAIRTRREYAEALRLSRVRVCPIWSLHTLFRRSE